MFALHKSYNSQVLNDLITSFYHSENVLSTQQLKLIAGIEAKLDRSIRKFGQAFVKLNHRSPKDVAIMFKDNERVKKILLQKLAESPNATDLEKAGLWNESLLESLKVTNGHDALDVWLLVIRH